MEDSVIVELYWRRDEKAVTETDAKYGSYCRSIAFNILADREDTEECVNDTYMGAWNSIPPHRPEILATFLGKITRRLSIKKWREKYAAKRGGGEIALALDELSECVPSHQNVEDELEISELTQTLNNFVISLPVKEMRVFICRYWYLDSISDISRQFGFSESKVKSMLFRTRHRLLTHLEKEGVL